jgi:predicted transcriptional regulator
MIKEKVFNRIKKDFMKELLEGYMMKYNTKQFTYKKKNYELVYNATKGFSLVRVKPF